MASIFGINAGDLLKNLGGEGLSDAERKRALGFGLLHMAAGTLANNRGNYGAFGPAAGAGLTQGLLGYHTQLGREEAGAKQRKQAKLMQDAFKGAIYQPTISGQEMQGYGVGGNFTQDEGTAQFMSEQAKSINDLLAQVPKKQPGVETFPLLADSPLVSSQLLPGMNQAEPLEDFRQEELMRQMNPQAAFEYNKQFGIATPNADGSWTMPPAFATAMQNVPMINPADVQDDMILPQTRKGPDTLGPEQFDMLKAARLLMKSGDPELMQQGFKIYTELQAKNPGLTSEVKNWQFSQNLTPEQRAEFSALTRSSGSIPSAIQEYEYVSKLTPEQRKLWFENKRAAQLMNLGGTMAVRQPGTGGIQEQYQVTPKPGETPELQGAQEAAKVSAREGVQRAYDAPKMLNKLAAASDKQKILDAAIDRAIKNAGFWSTGIMGQMLKGYGGTSAMNLKTTLDTIKAQMGFDELQEMRDNSPTGGALGQVAVQEINFLQSVIASLDQEQSNEQLIENLKIIKEAKRQSNARLRSAYEQTYGTGNQGNKPPLESFW